MIKQFKIRDELVTTTIQHMKDKDYITIDNDTN